MLLDIIIYYISYHYILHERELHIGWLVFKPHVGALFMAFCISFPVGFLLSKFVVFDRSHLRGTVQLLRYMLVVATNLFLNYILLKLMVEGWHFYPTVARVFITAFLVSFSYLSQKHFTFKTVTGNP
jgi:putative flippase GtrA